MCLFRRKNLTENNKKDREMISLNEKSFETLLILAKEDEFKDKIRAVQNKVKYLIPSTNDKVFNYDKKIKEAIGDLKISLTKDGSVETNNKLEKLLQEIEILIAERETVF